ncbi:general secretion pathway protein GspB [Massilia sp. CMS3.1]|uniref:general secretion pathway protein GspB n=1 Tax=Massilia sp. CMS3.1 TaxID=3373083 RepID=UPI003EE7DD27
MSYILEALKKAQAERQLGNAPDIHTPASMPVPAAASAANRKPLLIGLGVGLALAGLMAGLVLRSKAPEAQPAVLAQAATPPVAAGGMDLAPPSAPPAVAAQAPPVRAADAPVARPAAPAPAASRPAAAPAPRVAAASPAPSPAAVPEPVYLPAPAPARVPEPAAAPQVRNTDPILEENLRTLQQLPEAIGREVPKVAVGGYIYSPNPADRLLLVDKTLRREGEEVAPGLVLERLMPKYAVMNYRGTRYRVAY